MMSMWYSSLASHFHRAHTVNGFNQRKVRPQAVSCKLKTTVAPQATASNSPKADVKGRSPDNSIWQPAG